MDDNQNSNSKALSGSQSQQIKKRNTLSNYVYLNNGRWVRARSLPSVYRNYDLYNEYKVVLNDYRGDRPYDNFKTHKVKYGKGYKGKPQKTIGQKPGKGNNKEGKDNGHHDNGNHNGNGKGKGNGKH